MATEDELESRRIVRLYSFEVDERLPAGNDAYRLGQALGQDRGSIEDVTAPWRRFFDPWSPVGQSRDPITRVIEVESARLRERWMTFQTNAPKEDRLDIQRFEPTVEGVVDMVEEITKSWHSKREKGKRGKAMMYFHKFCRTLNSHSNLIKLLPEGNEYVSIFTGTLNAIIRASANHERIAEGLSEGLYTISEHIADIQGDLELYRTEEMLKLVADLYEHIFLFLSSVMEWIMEKRRKKLLDSFNESFNDRFTNELKTIRSKAERVRSMAAQSSRAETRVTRLAMEGIERDVRLGLEGNARHQAEMRFFAERLEKELAEAHRERQLESQRIKQLGSYVKLLLEERATGWIAGNRVSELEMVNTSLSMLSGAATRTTSWSSDEVAINSACLEDLFSRDRVRLPASDHASTIMVRPDVLSRLGEWTQRNVPNVLWLEGPAFEADDYENPLTMLAASYVDLLAGSRLPVLSYFIELRRNERLRDDNTSEVQAMVALLYALLRQMVELLLVRFDTNVDLSERRFHSLDGTLDSWTDGLSLFRDLLGLMPDTVFCIIDGLHWLEDRSTRDYLQELVAALRADKIKLLLTTSGRSGTLLQEVASKETLQIDNLERGASFRLDRQEFDSLPG